MTVLLSSSPLRITVLLMVVLPLTLGRPPDLVAQDSLLAVEDRRASRPGDLEQLQTWADGSDSTAALRAVRALGRLERPDLLPMLERGLRRTEAGLRAESAYAIAQAFFGAPANEALAALRQLLPDERSPRVLAALGTAIGRLRLSDAERATEAAQTLRWLAEQQLAVDAPNLTVLAGVTRGFDWLFRTNREHRWTTMTVDLLGALAQVEDPDHDTADAVRRHAVSALVNAGRVDASMAGRLLHDRDPEVRRMGTSVLTAGDLVTASLLRRALTDRDFTVRTEALRTWGATQQAALGCQPALDGLADPSPHVQLVAIDVMGAGCPDAPAADLLGFIVSREGHRLDWHRPVAALHALARLDADRAAGFLPWIMRHRNPFARAHAAGLAAATGNIAALYGLAADSVANVTERAVRGLSALTGHDADSVYRSLLAHHDDQLVMAAADALEGTPEPGEALEELVAAFERISAERRETSRDVRLAVLRRIREVGGPRHAARLRALPPDFDPLVADAIAGTLRDWTGEGAAPSLGAPAPPLALPTRADIEAMRESYVRLHMADGGAFDVRLFPDDAPTNAFRFFRLAREGYFDSLTFHRVEPNFVIQGGSPNANEYAGDGPYTRDEISTRSHRRGTVGLSTRGRDTGDAQIFVNLVDNPRLDFNYTIFGVVVRHMDVVDRVLEGAVISRIELVAAGDDPTPPGS